MREFTRANQLLLEQRAEAGDLLQETHTIQHFCYFNDRIKSLAAEAAFHVAGFDTSAIHRPLKSQIIVSHSSKIDQVTLDYVCEEISLITERYSGEYAGWDSPIIRIAS